MKIIKPLIFVLLLCSTAYAEELYRQMPLWSHHLGSKVTVILGEEKGFVIGFERGVSFLGLNKNIIWSYPTPNQVTSLSRSNGFIVTTTDGSVSKIDNQGRNVWSRQMPGYVGFENALDSDPQQILAGSMDGFIYIFDVNGTFKWKRLIGSYVTNVKILPDRLIAISDRQAYIMDLDGRVRRNLNISGYIRASQINSDRITIGLDDDLIYSYNLSGSLLWKKNIGQNIGVIREADELYVGTKQGKLFKISEGSDILWEKNMSDAVVALTASDEYLVVSTLDDQVRLYTSDGEFKWFYTANGRPNHVDISGPNIVVGTSSGVVSYSKIAKKDFETSLYIAAGMVLILGAALYMVSRSWN